MPDSGNGDALKQSISEVGAFKLAFRSLGVNATVDEIRMRVKHDNGFDGSGERQLRRGANPAATGQQEEKMC